MRALLDTHSFLWFIAGDPRLSEHARQVVADLEIAVLGIELAHLAAVSRLPLHHRDPFDLYSVRRVWRAALGLTCG